MKLTDAHESQKILPDTTRYVTVHLNNEFFFVSSASAFGSEQEPITRSVQLP